MHDRSLTTIPCTFSVYERHDFLIKSASLHGIKYFELHKACHIASLFRIVLEAGSDKSSEPIDDKTSVLKNIFGYESFKGKQEEAINAILDGDNCLIVLPTGG